MFRWSERDGWLVAAAVAHGLSTAAVLVWMAPRGIAGALIAGALFGAGVWWGSNTVSHNHLHNPFFHSRACNRAFSLYLSVLYAVPQSIWRERHLHHHAGERGRRPRLLTRQSLLETLAIAAVWLSVLVAAPQLIAVLMPGYVFGMALCQLQGRMEHARGELPGGVSHYGRLYNALWFNDGFHVEHHRWPGLHWTRLPERRALVDAPTSRFAPALRPLERLPALHGRLLNALERLALASKAVRIFMLWTHERAFSKLIARLPSRPCSVAIVGGGLFPRTLIVLQRLLPAARLVVVDQSAESVAAARRYLGDRAGAAAFAIEAFDPARHGGFDLVVAPLAFVGDRRDLLSVTRTAMLVTHDWIWRSGSDGSVVVSWLLLKRLSLHLRSSARAELALAEAA